MKNNQKGFIVPILILIIALLVIGGGVYIYQNKKAEVPAIIDNIGTQQTNQIQQQTNIQIPPVNMQTDNSNWKTYTNDKYGFEVKYPNDYFFTEGKAGISVRSSPECVGNEGGQWPKDCFSYSLFIQGNKITAEGREIKHSTTTVANHVAERIDNIGVDIDAVNTIVQFNKGNDWYINNVSYNLKNRAVSESIFNQILSTFKFTK